MHEPHDVETVNISLNVCKKNGLHPFGTFWHLLTHFDTLTPTPRARAPVSYTHLTLPTIYSV